MNLKKIAAAAWLAAGLCATSAFAGPPNYPFGSHLTPYVAGIKPTSASQASQDALIGKQYDYWKSQVQARCGGYIVAFTDGAATVSEGAGYGMLLSVVMAGHDSGAKELFDGLFKVVRSYPAYGLGEPALMEWKISGNCGSGGGGWNAMDGDLDIAMALLMADKQWGSDGAVNYRKEGLATIDAMKRRNFGPDGTSRGGPVAHVSRTSDYMLTHFRAFKRATNDPFWDLAVDRSLSLLATVQARFAPATGLIPDMLIYTDTANPRPDTLQIADGSPNAGDYWWNACRMPWRLASDYVTSGDERSKAVAGKLMDFLQRASGGAPNRIQSGYKLDGTGLSSYASASFIGPATVGAMVDARFQPFLNSLWSYSSENLARGYYDNELQLLSLIVASGNWWNPGTAEAPKPTVPAPTTVVPKPTIPAPQSPATPATQAAVHLQAESGYVSGSGVGVRNNLSGFEGSGFVGGFTNDGDSLTLGFPNVAAGTYDVKIRYQAWGPQQNGVVIDGVRRNESFAGTGAGWAVKTISGVPFAAGTHSVGVIKDWGHISVDWIEIVSTASSGAAAPVKSAVKVQAESGAVSGSGVGTLKDLAGFEGNGFVGSFKNSGDKLTIDVNGLATGTYNVRIRYQAWGSQQNQVVVNGKSRSETFPATGSMWAIKTLYGVPMTTGTNTVAIVKEWGYVNIDWIEVTP